MLFAYCAVLLRYPVRYESVISRECAAAGVERELVQAIIWAESKYRADALSKAGATGLMQLMPDTARWCAELAGVEYDAARLTEPEYNIALGVFYLALLSKEFSGRDAVAAYNAGPGNVRKWRAEGLREYPFKETRDYCADVFSSKKIYKRLKFKA
jgi:soluble lytic murein transglycosylase